MKRRTSSPDRNDELRSVVAEGLRDRYTVGELLGRGGMAVVFAGRDLERDRRVAIKVLNPDSASAVAAKRFVREILWSSSLQHPHIVPVLSSGEAGGLPYLVMPLVEGETLADRLARGPALELATALTFARQIASALDYAHRKGIVHRDIKPENVLISDEYALVADFGIARALGIASDNTLTGAGAPIGTLAYMSPEQAIGGPNVDGRSDIYSLGCVVFEMLAGRRAFDGTTLRQLADQQLNTIPPRLETIRPDVPPPVADAVGRALEKDPDRRFQTGSEFAAALGPVPVTTVDPSRPPARSIAGVWLLVAAVVAVAILVLTILRDS